MDENKLATFEDVKYALSTNTLLSALLDHLEGLSKQSATQAATIASLEKKVDEMSEVIAKINDQFQSLSEMAAKLVKDNAALAKQNRRLKEKEVAPTLVVAPEAVKVPEAPQPTVPEPSPEPKPAETPEPEKPVEKSEEEQLKEDANSFYKERQRISFTLKDIQRKFRCDAEYAEQVHQIMIKTGLVEKETPFILRKSKKGTRR